MTENMLENVNLIYFCLLVSDIISFTTEFHNISIFGTRVENENTQEKQKKIPNKKTHPKV